MTDLLENAADATTIITGLILIVPAVLAGFGIATLIFKKTRRLSSNLSRPFAIIPSKSDDMSAELTLLKDTGFFKGLKALGPNGRSIDKVSDDYRLVILRYDQNADYFWHTYDTLRTRQVPVIVYAKPGEIEMKTDMPRIQDYSFHALSNTPIRLLSDVWAVMSTYPEGKR